MADTLYNCLGGYDAIAAVCDDLLPRLVGDAQLARFWQSRARTAYAAKGNCWSISCAHALAAPLLRRPRHEDLASRDGHQRERLAALYWRVRQHDQQRRRGPCSSSTKSPPSRCTRHRPRTSPRLVFRAGPDRRSAASRLSSVQVQALRVRKLVASIRGRRRPRLRGFSDSAMILCHGPAARALLSAKPSEPGHGTISSAKYHQK
jgi:hypothetical protein